MDKRALLLTRPQGSAERFAAALSSDLLDGVKICISPLLEIVPTGLIPDFSKYSSVIFTSARAVMLSPKPEGRQAFCVGDRTAKAAEADGWEVAIVARDAERLVAAMQSEQIEGPLIHLAGAHRRGQIAEKMIQFGVQVDVVTLYAQNLLPLSEEAKELLSGELPVIVPLFSPRTAAQLVNQAPVINCAHFAAISAAVAEIMRKYDLGHLHIADEPTGGEMTRLVEMLLRKNSLA